MAALVAQHRSARLALGNRFLYLDDPDSGYVCTSLDVGYPSVREVVNNRPAANGTDDQTTLFGSRAVSANITAWRDRATTKTVDDIADLFAPFMVASARPTLIWTTESSTTGERFLTLRPADFSSAMTNASGGSIAMRNMQLQWVAPDPVAYDMNEQMAVAYAGSSVRAGRVYDGPPTRPATDYGVIDANGNTGWGFHPDRSYPPGGRDPSVGWIHNAGDVAVSPLLRVYGPITGPVIRGDYLDQAGAHITWQVVARPSLHVDPGGWVDIDTDRKTVVVGGTCLNLIAQLDWMATTWPAIPPGSTSSLQISGDTTTETSRVEATWRNGWLTT